MEVGFFTLTVLAPNRTDFQPLREPPHLPKTALNVESQGNEATALLDATAARLPSLALAGGEGNLAP